MPFFALLGTSLGTLAYHVAILFIVEAMFGIALVEGLRTLHRDWRRMSFAFVCLLIMRTLLILDEFGGSESITSLAGTIEVASLTLLGWAFVVSVLNRHTSAAYLAAGLSMALLSAIASWLPANWYHGSEWLARSVQSVLEGRSLSYGVGTFLAMAPALILLRARWREGEWLPAAGFSILFVGSAVAWISETLSVAAGASTSVATATHAGHITYLLGYALLTTALYRIALQDAQAYRAKLPAASELALGHTHGPLLLTGTGQATSKPINLNTVLRRAVRSARIALHADRAAIFLIGSDTPGAITLVAQCTPLQGKYKNLAEPTVALGEQPILAYALGRHKQLIVNSETHSRHLRNLYELLGSEGAGPLIVQPLSRQQRTVGALVVGNDRSQRAFGPGEGKLCRRIGDQVTAAMDNLHQHYGAEAQVARLSELLRLQQGEAQRTTGILESIAEGVIVSDENGRITTANAAAARILNIPHERILGQPIGHMLTDTALDPQANRSAVAQFDGPVKTTFETENGVIHVSAAPVRTLTGDYAGVVAILRDITQETEAERARSEFITAISQGLRSPLTAVRGYAEALSSGLAGTVTETQSHFLKIIRDNALRMVSLVENLVAASQIEKGFLTLQYGETNLSRLISDVVRSFQHELEARQLELSLDVDDDQALIEADPARVRQVLENLVSNAIKFTYPGGKVTIGARPLRDVEGQPPTHYSIWVADTGIGISAEEQPHIWGRYYRPANSLAGEAGELSMGLSIVKSLVEAHNGRVWVESTPGVGSTFTVLLPIKRIQPISDERSQAHTSLGTS